jgi:hypothetical protein
LDWQNSFGKANIQLLRLNHFVFINLSSQKQPHPCVFQNFPLASPVFLEHKRYISNFINVYSTLGCYGIAAKPIMGKGINWFFNGSQAILLQRL